jgi:hypothetical protein
MTLSNELKQYLKNKNEDVNKTEQQQGDETAPTAVQINEESNDELIKSDNALKSFLIYVKIHLHLHIIFVNLFFTNKEKCYRIK